MMNAVFYMITAGCRRRMHPDNFAPWNTVYIYSESGKTKI
ncbi:MAG: transposase [Prevotellaceae bacterium]|nr:transposase [Prevotellaceae bacterium]